MDATLIDPSKREFLTKGMTAGAFGLVLTAAPFLNHASAATHDSSQTSGTAPATSGEGDATYAWLGTPIW